MNILRKECQTVVVYYFGILSSKDSCSVASTKKPSDSNSGGSDVNESLENA